MHTQNTIKIPLETSVPGHKHIGYPPGGILMWVIIMLELGTFGMGIAAIVYYGRVEPEVFTAAASHPNRGIGTVNTALLLLSGFWMAKSVEAIKAGYRRRSVRFLIFTILGGLAFSLLKGYEYAEKLKADITLGGNMFETLYWLLTGFHLIHVWVGMIILSIMIFRIHKLPDYAHAGDLESAGAFWHMCDLIWLFLFPSLYLLY